MDAITAATQTSSDKKNVLSYYLKVKGIFGRNRKVKFQVFSVLKDVDPMEHLPADEMARIAMGVLADEVKLKSGYAVLAEQPEEVEHRNGYTTRCFAIFSDRKLWTLSRTPGADDVITHGGNK